jgi:2-keto-4-pentenoate hydratase
MTLDADAIDGLAAAYQEAERGRRPVPPLAERHPGLTLDDAYRVQARTVERKLAAGFALAGMKVGSTSKRMQERFGVREPVCGWLFRERRWANGGTIDAGQLIDPKVECEIAFRMGRRLSGPGVTEDGALAAAAAVMGAFEIIDSRTQGWRGGAVDLVADNAVGAGFVLGSERPPAPGLDLAATAAAFAKNGGEPSRGSGAVVLGHPARVLAWLANWLGGRGRALEEGWVVLTGSLAEAYPAKAGDRFEAAYTDLGRIDVNFS